MKDSGQYSTSGNLEARIRIYRFNESDNNWWDFVWTKAGILPGMRILEVGCGNGVLWKHNLDKIPVDASITLADLSEGMLKDARSQLGDASFAYVQADIQELPFMDSSFDLVVANHMLYHVPDLEKGIGELKRVLSRNGCLMASTNSLTHLVELKHLAESFNPPVRFPGGELTAKFGLENGESILRQHFTEVNADTFDSRLRVTDPNAIVAYISSLDSKKSVLNGGNLTRFTGMVEDRMKETGTFSITTQSCIFTAKNR